MEKYCCVSFFRVRDQSQDGNLNVKMPSQGFLIVWKEKEKKEKGIEQTHRHKNRNVERILLLTRKRYTKLNFGQV